MKQNLDCIRDILLLAEEHTGFNDDMEQQTLPLPKIIELLPNYPKGEIANSFMLLYKGDYITAMVVDADRNPLYVAIIHDLTERGYQFLESIREPKRWDKIKNTMKEKAIPFILDKAFDFAIAKFSS